MKAGLVALCRTDAVRPDTPVRAEKDGRSYAVFVVGDRYYVTEDACTHGPGSLADGFVDGEEIECPFHQGRFHIPTGRPSTPPCTIALRIWQVQIIDGKVCIEPDESL
jgi:nitrite reductase/ring-hydroxylating ferredoxin subunit